MQSEREGNAKIREAKDKAKAKDAICKRRKLKYMVIKKVV
jgi:hypothetical protein